MKHTSKILPLTAIAIVFLFSNYTTQPRRKKAEAGRSDSASLNPNNADQTLEADQAGAMFGFSLAPAGDINGDGYGEVIVGAPLFDNGQEDEGAAFLFYGSADGLTAMPVTLEIDQAHAQAGFSVSGAGDVNKDGFSDIAVGAPYYGHGQADEGAVLIYLGSAKGVKPAPVIVLEQNQEDARLGTAVALAGDVNADGFSDLVAGAIYFHNGQMNEGAAFVYYGGINGISPGKFSTIEGNRTGARLGAAVAGAGDVNGDGFGDVVVGATLYGNGQEGEGAVFLCYGSNVGLNSANPVIIERNQAHARLGKAVACAGDINGDGYSDIAIAAPYFDNGQSNEGVVFVHYGSATGISLNPSKTLESDLMDAELGMALACAGDINGDGYADLLIGARYWGKGQKDAGAALIYHGSPTGLNAKPEKIINGTQMQSFTGSALASAGDVNGDGYSDIAIGAHLFDKGQQDEGTVSIYYGSPGKLATDLPNSLTGSQVIARYGASVAAVGDVNGDGYGDVIVGAPHYDNGQAEEGAAFVYLGTANGLSPNFAVMLSAGQGGAEFGGSVAGAGDVNGDGYDDIVVGAMHYDNGQDEEGAAFVYLGSASGINAQAVAILESNQSGAWLGSAVAGAGDVNNDGFADLVLGAMNYTNGESEEGALYLYPGSPTGPNAAGLTIIENNLVDARLGNSVSAAGDVNGDGYGDIVAGAYAFEDDDRGALFTYHGGPAGLNPTPASAIEGTQPYAQMGWDVSGAGDINADGYADIIAGCHWYNYEDGAAFVYYGSANGIDTANATGLFPHSQGMAVNMGESVSGAGDINGDGYSDIIIGVPRYIDEQTSILTGQALVYFGHPTGIQNDPLTLTGNPNDEYDFFGWAVSYAGDINADGYSDIMVGSPNYGSSQTDAEAAHIYYGNMGSGLRHNLRLYNNDLSTIINQNQKSQNAFGAGLFTKSFLGAGSAKLVWETKGAGSGFSQSPNGKITNSTQITGSQTTFTNIGTAGMELKQMMIKQGVSTKVRVRAHYNPALALTGQTYGPWRYLPSYLTGNAIAPLPERVTNGMSETIKKMADLDRRQWNDQIYIYPNPASDHIQTRHEHPELVSSIKLLTTGGRLISRTDNSATSISLKGLNAGVYFLVINHSDGSQISKKVVVQPSAH